MNPLTASILRSIYIDNSTSNWVFSPASYLEAMSNLAVCLKGQNLAELVGVAPDIERPQAIGLETYNCLLYSSEYREALNEAVVEVIQSRGGELKSFDGPEVVGLVNAIVREKTRGKIDNLITESDITEFTKFIILNCVYFKKAWVCPFEEKWVAEDFKGATKTSHVKFLHHKINLGQERYYEDDKVDIAELRYRDSDVACYLIVPKNNLFELFNEIEATIAKIGQVKSGLDLDVTVPPFKIESTFPDLSRYTDIAGVKNVFRYSKDWELLDWRKLKSETVMKVEKIIQKAFIEFNKEGTEAAAATAIIGGISGCFFMPREEPPVKYIRADRPFIYVLANQNAPDKPLFVGVVNDVPDSPTGTPYVNGCYDSKSLFAIVSGDALKTL